MHRLGSRTWFWDPLPDFCLWQSKPDIVNCNPTPPALSLAVGQNHHQEPELLNLMAKSVDKDHRIRYIFYGILNYWI